MAQRVRKRVQEPEVRRDQIVGEAIRIVGEKGSNGLTIQELARRCGLSNAGLLYYYSSKEQLLLASLQELERREMEVMAPIAEAAKRELEHGDGSTEGLRHLLRTIVTRATDKAWLGLPYLVLQAEALDPDHPAHDSFRRREAAVLDLFETLVSPHVRHSRSAARQLLALMDGLMQQWVRNGEPFDIAVEWDLAVTAILGKSGTGNGQPVLTARPH